MWHLQGPKDSPASSLTVSRPDVRPLTFLVGSRVSQTCLFIFALLPRVAVPPPPPVPRALAHLVQDGDARGLGELPVQQWVGVHGVCFHVGGVARQQVGQADARGAIA